MNEEAAIPIVVASFLYEKVQGTTKFYILAAPLFWAILHFRSTFVLSSGGSHYNFYIFWPMMGWAVDNLACEIRLCP